ncbi:hypothetical protein [Sphingomonas sp.]|uniref:hypothetical protein n=1 Tax=Sphingomonas sp. TaxID=28214 RepID=UPI003B006565
MATAAVLALTTTVGAADPPAPAAPPRPDLSRRAAEVDAYRNLAESVMGVHLTADTTVRNYVARSDAIATALDTCIKGARFGPPRQYGDGSCEVDATLSLTDVITALKKSATTGTPPPDLAALERRATTEPEVTATGMGVADPAAEADAARVVWPGGTPVPPWQVFQADPQAVANARRVAQVTAARNLFEQVCGLRVSATTTARQFVTRSDHLRTATAGVLRGYGVAAVAYRPDGTVAVRLEMTVAQAVAALKQADPADAAKFDAISPQTAHRILRAVGTASVAANRPDANGDPPSP